MVSNLEVGGVRVTVTRKDIKNVHLSVYPPSGAVRMSAPERMSLGTVRLFVIAKLPWIREQQKKLREQERETPREYLNREGHYLWGRRLLLKVVETDETPTVHVRHSSLVLRGRVGGGVLQREAVLSAWYREQIRMAAPPLIEAWRRRLGVTVNGLYVRQMKTKWGSCNPVAGTIRLNTELAKKPPECLEYIVVHELVHLIEAKHGARFVAAMDRRLPAWRHTRDLLNRLPARHERWTY